MKFLQWVCLPVVFCAILVAAVLLGIDLRRQEREPPP